MGRARILLCRKNKISLYFFVCLFLFLISIREPQAEVNPKEAKAIAALANNPWAIYVTYQKMHKGKITSSVESDILTFTEYAVLSGNLKRQGYSKDGASYQVKIKPDGAYTWQAIMLHENQKDTVLLKGDLKGEVMTGVIVYQPEGRPVRTANFSTISPENNKEGGKK